MSVTDLTELNQRFGIPGALVFNFGPGGLTVAEIANEAATARLALHGAHLIDWQPRGAEPVLWLSRSAVFAPDRAIRGGIPICWPWFGPHPTEAELPAHGYARLLEWAVVETVAVSSSLTQLTLRLSVPSQTRGDLGTALEVRFTIGAALAIELVSSNPGSRPVSISMALHSYFRVGDAGQVVIRGLEECEYIDKTRNGERNRQSGEIRLAEEVDRCYLNTSAPVLIDDPVLRRRIRIVKQGSASTVVWNPWAERARALADFDATGFGQMVCVESGNVEDNRIVLGSGEVHRLRVRYALDNQATPSE